MALVKCPECQREISDLAPACIHCGCPATDAGPAAGAAVPPPPEGAPKSRLGLDYRIPPSPSLGRRVRHRFKYVTTPTSWFSATWLGLLIALVAGALLYVNWPAVRPWIAAKLGGGRVERAQSPQAPEE